jgi:hypothetical protein
MRCDAAAACRFVVACAALVAGACAPAHYVRVAEALTVPTLSDTIRASHELTDAERVRACQQPVRVARLEVSPSRLEMMTGGRYELSSLSIVAIDEAGVSVPRVPIVLEAEETVPSRVQLRSEDPDLADGRLVAVEPGKFHVRIRTICPVGEAAEKVITGRVRP